MRRSPIEQLEVLSRENNGTPVQWSISMSLPVEIILIEADTAADVACSWGEDVRIGEEEDDEEGQTGEASGSRP